MKKLKLVGAERFGNPTVKGGNPVLRGEEVAVDNAIADRLLTTFFLDAAGNKKPIWEEVSVPVAEPASTKKGARRPRREVAAEAEE